MTIVLDYAYISGLTLEEVKQKLEKEIDLQDENINQIDIIIAQDLPIDFYSQIVLFISERCYTYYETTLEKPHPDTMETSHYSGAFLFYIASHLHTLPEPNYQDIAHLLFQAAEKGHAEAMSNIGVLYCCGYLNDDRNPNYHEALEWYTKAAEYGNVAAMFCIGDLHSLGCLSTDGTPNYQEALKWYSRAAEKGNAIAMYNIGSLYHSGYLNDDRSPDYHQALKWHSQAAEEGLPFALSAFISVSMQLAIDCPEQVDRAIEGSKCFFERHINSADYIYKQEALNAFCAEVASFATYTYPEGRDILVDQHRAAFGHILIEFVAGKNESYLSYDQQIDLGSIEGGRKAFIDCLQKGFYVYWQEHHPVDQETEPPVLELSPENLSLASIAQAVNALLETKASISSNVQHQTAIANTYTSSTLSVSRG